MYNFNMRKIKKRFHYLYNNTFRLPFLAIVAGMHKKYILYEVNGTKAIEPGTGGHGGRGGYGGNPGKAAIFGLRYMPKFTVFNKTGIL